MDLKQLNQVSLTVEAEKETKKLADLIPNLIHKIIDARSVNTRFGPAVLIELENFVVFLPKRVIEVYTPFIEYFKSGKYGIILRGVKEPTNQVQFEIAEI